MHNFFGLFKTPKINLKIDLEKYDILEKFQFLLFSFIFMIYPSLYFTIQLNINIS